MPQVNYLAVVAAAVVAFVASSVWYLLFGNLMMRLRGAGSGAAVEMGNVPAWKKLAEVLRSVVVAYVLARFVVLLGVVGWASAAGLGFWVWLGFPAVLLFGSVMWENVPPKLAAIHAGDWLVKLLLMTVMLGVWR
jgi:hypothetical protein